MSETRLIRLVAARGTGIPQSMKTFRTIHVSGESTGKVIRVALPQQQHLVLAKSSPQNTIPENQEEEHDADGVPLSKNALLARENRLKKKRYINGLEQNLSTVKKEKEVLAGELKEKDQTIEKLKKEITYFKSVLANVREISSLINTIKSDGCGMPISTSLEPPAAKKMKYERLSESSSELSSIHEDCDDWMAQTPQPVTTQLDAESLDLLSNFSEEDINLFGDTLPETSQPAGVCLHVNNKKLSLEFCSSCAIRAQEKWFQV